MRRIIGVALVAAPLFAAYTYYFSDPLTSINTSNWWQNGPLSAGSSGLTSSDGNGGSLISKVTVPAPGASQYEVKATVNLVQSGGTYVVYLRASQDALSAASPSGTYYAFELQNPQISGSTCSATFVLNKRVNGVVSNLATFSSAVCSVNTNVIRGVITNNGSQITAFLNGMQYLWTSDSSIASGQPGIGVRAAPSANTITNVALGPLDTVAPTAVPAQSIRTSSFATHIDFQWQGTTDNQDGIGLLTYQIQRNGVGLANLNGSFPTFNDTTVTAGTTYTYTIAAIDYHMNAALTQVQVRVPAAGDIDPREVGVRPTGTYWGAAGEQIDIRSGNLNYTMPLVKPMANGNWGTTLNLTYNSQNWRQDSSTNWKLGDDVGYGFGWKLQAGSLLPVYSGYWTLDHYLFTDATGAEYRLNRNNGGVWSSTEGIYVYFDSNTGILHFRDGSFWKMQCISAGTEQDAGTMYPTTIQDSNGNQIIVDYWPGTGISGSNSSARIQDIKDARKVSIYPSYAFSYNSDTPTPHLTGITNYIQTAESYTFSIPNGVAIVSPFDGTSFGTTGKLSSITQTPTSMTTSFTYNTSLEMTQMTTPYQGSISWGYGTFAYHSSRSQREVQDRYLVKALGAAQKHYTFIRDNASNGQVHASVLLDDPGGSGGGNGEKAWFFQTNTSGFDGGLITSYDERKMPGQVSTSLSAYTWTQDGASNPYIQNVLTTLDGSSSYRKQTWQSLDQYGNVTQMKMFDFGNLSTPARTYNYTYLTDDNCNLGHHPCFTSYASNYIFNRLLTASVTDGTNTATLVSNTYDYNNLNDLSGLTQHDANYGTTFRSRGNVYGSTTLTGVSQATTIDIRGNPVSTSVNGVTVTTQSSSTFNYAVPTQITANSMNEILNWSTFLAIQSETGPNGDVASIGYDSAGRPGSSQSPYGATTYYGYNDTASPPTHTATTNGRTMTTTLDGFGRTIQADNAVGATKYSTVETNYDSCACSPLGKIWRRSQPYAPNGTKYWTTYNYDGLGRTTSVVLPDNSTTSYLYTGNTVRVTDAANKMKTFTMDAFGNLTRVDETDPVLGAVYTTYTYDVLNHLTGVSMPRNSYTQTRTFNYKVSTTVTADLQSATNPETGTVTYTYDSYHRLYTKTDAKGQVLTYSRDSLGRVLYVYCCTVGSTNALRTYTYDSDATGFSHYVQGRLSSVAYAGGTGPQLTDRYSYKQSGLVETKRVQVTQTLAWVNNQDTRKARRRRSIWIWRICTTTRARSAR